MGGDIYSGWHVFPEYAALVSCRAVAYCNKTPKKFGFTTLDKPEHFVAHQNQCILQEQLKQSFGHQSTEPHHEPLQCIATRGISQISNTTYDIFVHYLARIFKLDPRTMVNVLSKQQADALRKLALSQVPPNIVFNDQLFNSQSNLITNMQAQLHLNEVIEEIEDSEED